MQVFSWFFQILNALVFQLLILESLVFRLIGCSLAGVEAVGVLKLLWDYCRLMRGDEELRERMRKRLRFIVLKYKETRDFWQFVQWGRQLFSVGLATLIGVHSPVGAAVATISVNSVYFVLLCIARPYEVQT